jgi:uncharacterized protein YjbJ (UPF0337 family)
MSEWWVGALGVLHRAAAPARHTSRTKETIMNWDIIAGDWKQFHGKVKEKWGKLTSDQLAMIAGKRDQLSGTIQATYGITKDQAERQIKAFEDIQAVQSKSAKPL